MQDDRDYYTILGVPADAPEAEVRRAFRARAKELHPDSKPSGEHDEAHSEFSLLTEAYETLKDAGRRQAYDDALRSSRQLTARGASESKPPRAFAMGLALGLLLALAAVGAKVSYDRAGNSSVPKSQESLRMQKTGEPSAAAPRPLETAAQRPMRSAEAPALEAANPAPGAPAERSPEPAVSGAPPPGETLSGQPEAAPPPPDAASASLPGQNKALHSQFAEEVLSLEDAVSSDGSGSAAYRLLSLVNSSKAIGELTEAASLASKPETVDLIQSRMAALKEERGRAALTAKEPNLSLQGSGGARLREDGTVEVATGPLMNETVLRLRPGNGIRESFSDCANCPEMVAIPSGQAMIGSRPDGPAFRPEEAPAHRISIRWPIAVSKHGISAENWRACVEAGACRPTLASYLSIGPGVAATRVSWFDAKSYAEWLSQRTGRHYRLLSEAEWEYAAEAGRSGYGPENPVKPGLASSGKAIAPSLLRIGGRAGRLGQTKPNAWGLHPLPGTLLEWVEDCWHANYSQARSDGSPWLSADGGDCAYRAVRGIAATGGEFGGRRLAARAREFADARSPTLGFRVARELSAPAKTAVDASALPRGKAARGD
ncbi:MAG: SUMF1/EgtB/PvdO family nonheme iron enzyme [Rhodomicrobium sp.]